MCLLRVACCRLMCQSILGFKVVPCSYSVDVFLCWVCFQKHIPLKQKEEWTVEKKLANGTIQEDPSSHNGNGDLIPALLEITIGGRISFDSMRIQTWRWATAQKFLLSYTWRMPIDSNTGSCRCQTTWAHYGPSCTAVHDIMLGIISKAGPRGNTISLRRHRSVAPDTQH